MGINNNTCFTLIAGNSHQEATELDMELGGSIHCTLTHRSEKTDAVHLALSGPPYATVSIVGVQDLSREQKCTIINTSCFLTLIMLVLKLV